MCHLVHLGILVRIDGLPTSAQLMCLVEVPLLVESFLLVPLLVESFHEVPLVDESLLFLACMDQFVIIMCRFLSLVRASLEKSKN